VSCTQQWQHNNNMTKGIFFVSWKQHWFKHDVASLYNKLTTKDSLQDLISYFVYLKNI
jgi:hypothetical protein